MEADPLADWTEMRSSLLGPGHHYPSVFVQDHAYLHQGDIYNQSIILPQHKPEAGIRSFGVCLGDAPQISADAFKGRLDYLESLKDSLLPADRPGRSIVSIVGIGGVGKTQLSLAYTREHGQQYSSVFWLKANDEATLRQELVLLYGSVFPSSEDIATKTPEGEQLAIERVKQWLSESENDKWLIVFDNYDNPFFSETPTSPTNGFDIRAFFPSRSQGNILITTRSTKIFFSQQLHLGKIEHVNTSVAILSQRSRRDLYQDPGAFDLAERLDGLPLALATAGAFLASTAMSCTEYRHLYESMWKQISDADMGQLADYPQRTLSTTWSISLDHVRARDPNAASLLEFMAFLSPHDIWYELLRAGSDAGLPWLKSVTQDQLHFQRAMSLLHGSCLIEVVNNSYQVHPCLHDWIVQLLPNNAEQASFIAAMRCIKGSAFNEDSPRYSAQRYRLSNHVFQLTSPRFDSLWELSCNKPEVCGLALDVVHMQMKLNLYEQVGGLERVGDLCRLILRGCEPSLGPEHPLTLETMGVIGTVFHKLNDFEQSEHWLFTTLLRQSGLNARESPSVTDVMKVLESRYFSPQIHTSQSPEITGRPAMATPKIKPTQVFDTVWELRMLYFHLSKSTVLQEIDQVILRSLNELPDLGTTRRLYILYFLSLSTEANRSGVMDRYSSEACALLNCAPELDTMATVRTLYYLGNMYRDVGNNDAAERTLLRALEGSERILGTDHYVTRRIQLSLSFLYSTNGRLHEAESLYLQAADGNGKYPNIGKRKVWAARKLGDLHVKQGNSARAEELYELALDGMIKIYGRDNIHSIRILSSLAQVYVKTGQSEKAKPMIQQVLLGSQEMVDRDRVDKLENLQNLARIYNELGRLPEAEPMFLSIVTKRERIYGKDDKRTLYAMDNLADTYLILSRFQEAGPLYESVLAGYTKLYGQTDTRTVRVMDDLAYTHMKLGRFQEAEPLFESVLTEFKKVHGETGKKTLRVMDDLASIYTKFGRFREAVPMRQSILATYKELHGETDFKTLWATRHLAYVYTKVGRSSEARQMLSHVLAEYKEQLGPEHSKVLKVLEMLHEMDNTDENPVVEQLVQCIPLAPLSPDVPQSPKSKSVLKRLTGFWQRSPRMTE